MTRAGTFYEWQLRQESPIFAVQGGVETATSDFALSEETAVAREENVEKKMVIDHPLDK